MHLVCVEKVQSCQRYKSYTLKGTVPATTCCTPKVQCLHISFWQHKNIKQTKILSTDLHLKSILCLNQKAQRLQNQGLLSPQILKCHQRHQNLQSPKALQNRKLFHRASLQRLQSPSHQNRKCPRKSEGCQWASDEAPPLVQDKVRC